MLSHSVSKVYTKGVVLKISERQLRIPSVEFVYVDIEEVVRGEEALLLEMKENTDNQIKVGRQGF